MSESNQINSIKRAFSVLETLYKSSEPMGVSALAAAHGLPKVTMFRILASLLECDAVRKDTHNGQLIFKALRRFKHGVSKHLRTYRNGYHEIRIHFYPFKSRRCFFGSSSAFTSFAFYELRLHELYLYEFHLQKAAFIQVPS